MGRLFGSIIWKHTGKKEILRQDAPTNNDDDTDANDAGGINFNVS